MQKLIEYFYLFIKIPFSYSSSFSFIIGLQRSMPIFTFTRQHKKPKVVAFTAQGYTKDITDTI